MCKLDPPTAQQRKLRSLARARRLNSSAPLLPPNILNTIIAYAKALPREDGSSWINDISSLRLVAKRYESACRVALFRTLVITVEKNPKDSTGQVQSVDAPGGLAEFVKLFPCAAQIVRCLVVRYVDCCPLRSHHDKSLHGALNKLNITEVHLEGVSPNRRQPAFEMFPRRSGMFGPLDTALRDVISKKQMQKLVLRNVAIAAAFLCMCGGFKHLESHNSSWWTVQEDLHPSNMDSSDSENEDASPAPPPPIIRRIYPNTLVYTGDTTLDDMHLNSGFGFRRFPFGWAELDSLSFPVQAKHGRLYRNILEGAKCLKKIHLHGPVHISHPASEEGDDEAKGTIAPLCEPLLKHLNSESYKAMTHIYLAATITTYHGGAFVSNPYCSLLRDGVIQKLANLREISCRVLIKGVKISTLEKFSFGSHWGELDRVLAPAGRAPPCSYLRKVSVYCAAPDFMRVHSQAIDRMFATQFTGLRRLEREGRIDLLLEGVA